MTEPAEIQQQLIQCIDLLRKFETSHTIRPEAMHHVDFFHNWYDALVSARERYLEQEHITEAQWNVLAQDGLTW